MKTETKELINYVKKNLEKYKENPTLWDYHIKIMEKILDILKKEK